MFRFGMETCNLLPAGKYTSKTMHFFTFFLQHIDDKIKKIFMISSVN